jgi:hypothetical protein
MERGIMPAIAEDFPGIAQEKISLTVLLHNHGTKGGETVVGVGLRFPVPERTPVPGEYRMFPRDFVRRGETLEKGNPETFDGYRVESGRMAFLIGKTQGCSADGLRELFRIQDLRFPDADPMRSFLLFFSRGSERGKIGLRFSTGPSSNTLLDADAVMELPRCVP